MLPHDPQGVAHELGHGQLAGPVSAGLEPLDDLVGWGGSVAGSASQAASAARPPAVIR
jgi:hypothetical protein